MRPWLTEHFSGAGAFHSGGVNARRALDQAREQSAAFVKAAPEEIIFTSSGTEAINLAIKGCALANQRRGKHIILSAIEHPAIAESVAFLQTLGFEATTIPVSSEGFIDPTAIKDSLRDDTILVCAHAANHDLATIQNLSAIGEIVADHGADLLIDATYAGGWLELDVQKFAASYLAISPLRFNGPKGSGILYKSRRAQLAPQIHGGIQETGWRAGGENIPAIIGAGLACELASLEMPTRITAVRPIQQHLWTQIQSTIKDVRLNGPAPGDRRLPNSLNISIADLEGEGLALNLDLKGFQIGAGAACLSKSSEVPATLAAIGLEPRFALGTIILSFSPENTRAEADRFIEALRAAVARLREL